MNGILNFETFLIAGILLNLTPGNDTIFILAKSMGQGKKAGIISALGIATGSLVHTLLAAFGLSLIIANSILLFNIIKYAGAAYLIFIGIRMLMDQKALKIGPVEFENSGDSAGDTGNSREFLHTSNSRDSQNSINSVNYISIYRDAILTNVLNPKVALFFIAFLPQFIDPNFKHSIFPFLLLGTTFIITGTAWCMVLAIFASALSGKLKSNSKMANGINKVCGLALIGLGIKVALTGRK